MEQKKKEKEKEINFVTEGLSCFDCLQYLKSPRKNYELLDLNNFPKPIQTTIKYVQETGKEKINDFNICAIPGESLLKEALKKMIENKTITLFDHLGYFNVIGVRGMDPLLKPFPTFFYYN